jgi:D-amino-acid dehydrogenase
VRVAVIGAGIIGITTAYELAVDGHEVTVFERRSAAAEEASFANAGIVAPGYVVPWAAPDTPGKVLAHLFSRHASLRLSLPVSRHELAWMLEWMRAGKLEKCLANRTSLQHLAFYSRHRVHVLTALRELEYERSPGYMVLLRSEKERRQAQYGLQALHDAGVKFSQIDADEARQIEPALNPDAELRGAVYLPDDEVANCRQFALLLKGQAHQLGVNFLFNTVVTQLDRAQPATILIAGENLPRRFDRVVMCAGVASAELLRPLGLTIPMAAVYGYSISAPIREPLNAPRSALRDERHKVVICRLGNRVRVAGSWEIGGSLDRNREAAIRTLYKVLHDWFPGAAQYASISGSVQVWKGACSILPDGLPIIGDSGIPGLWLNFGHGSNGWALSCGSARALADLLVVKSAEIDMEGLNIERLA